VQVTEETEANRIPLTAKAEVQVAEDMGEEEVLEVGYT
jgi:hypothetical protein